MKAVCGAILFGIFLFVAVMGLPMLLTHSDHYAGCPLQSAGAVMCESTVIEHFSMWQAMFASIVYSVALLIGVAVSARTSIDLSFAEERVRIRLRALETVRPTLMQELFSRGILNRKEPYAFS